MDMDVVKKVSSFIKEYNLMDKNSKILLAVSGGIDSIVLLDIVCKLFPKNKKVMLHVDHRIREDTKKDIDLVKGLSNKYQIKLYIRKINVLDYCKEKKLGIEEGARKLRYQEFLKIFKKENLDYILTAHNLNDLAENFIMRVIRGSGVDGIPGMKPKNGYFIKPMLNIKKSDIIKYAKSNNLKWREDYTNKDLAYTRNSIRHKLIPIMEEYNPNFLISVLKLSKILWMQQEYNKKQIERFKIKKSKKTFQLNIADLKKTSKFLAYEVIKNAIQEFSGSVYGFEFENIQSIYKLCFSKSGAIYKKNGITIIKEYNNLTFIKDNDFKKKNFYAEIFNNGNYYIDNHIVKVLNVKPDYFPLTIRAYKKEDKIKIKNGHKKIGKFLSDKKVPHHLRKNALIVLNKNSDIISIIGIEKFNTKFENNKKNIISIKECGGIE